MITKIIKARRKTKYKPAIGDILSGADYFEKIEDKDPQAVLLGAFGTNTWLVLQKLGVDVLAVMEEMEYVCPYLNYKFYWCMPVALCGEIDKYKRNAIKAFGKMQAGYGFDTQFINECGSIGDTPIDWKLNDVTNLFMGSGYTYGTGAWDGHHSRVRVKIPLENGDWLLAEVWEWYNK
jgi:hypothetical protein